MQNKKERINECHGVDFSNMQIESEKMNLILMLNFSIKLRLKTT